MAVLSVSHKTLKSLINIVVRKCQIFFSLYTSTGKKKTQNFNDKIHVVMNENFEKQENNHTP